MQIVTEANWINQNQHIPSYIASVQASNEIITEELKRIKEEENNKDKVEKIEPVKEIEKTKNNLYLDKGNFLNLKV